jgi:hypothetical protein
MNASLAMRSHRSSSGNSRRTGVSLAMPDRTNFILGLAAGALAVIYVGIMITTIIFASWQTQLARGIDDSRSRIQSLEDDYYHAIAKLDNTDPHSVGLVAPSKVEYVTAARMQNGLTFAGN